MRLILAGLLGLLSVAVNCTALGPKVARAALKFTHSTSPMVSGYWLYWRFTNTAFADEQRWPVSTNVVTVGTNTNAGIFDLKQLGLPAGVYVLAMTATNLNENESSFSVEATWDATIPNKPVIIEIGK